MASSGRRGSRGIVAYFVLRLSCSHRTPTHLSWQVTHSAQRGDAMGVKNTHIIPAAALLLLSFHLFSVSSFTLTRWNGLCRPRSILSRLVAPYLNLPPMTTKFAADDDENDIESEIDSFLRGDYNHPFAPDAPAPHPGLSPRATIEAVLMALHNLNKPAPSHGAAILQRFCAPLSRAEKWGGAPAVDAWKQVLRGALTPTMLARRIRASAFSVLLDWTSVDVTDGYSMAERDLIGVPSLAFVNAALFFGDGVEPCLVQFTLRRFSGVWLIDTARVSKKELFQASTNETTTSS